MRLDVGLALGAAVVALAMYISPASGSSMVEDDRLVAPLKGSIYEEGYSMRHASATASDQPIWVATLDVPESATMPVAGRFGIRSDGCSVWKHPSGRMAKELNFQRERVTDPINLHFLRQYVRDLVSASKLFTAAERDYVLALCKD